VKYLTVQEIWFAGDLTSFVDRVQALMDALLDIEDSDSGIGDPDLASNLAEGRADVQMVIEADGAPEAMTKALCALRTAVHAIGDATPGWETERAVLHVAPLDISERLFAHA
jgi:hypothetical protein